MVFWDCWGITCSVGLRWRHACDDGAQQAVPGREQEICGDGAEVFEQASAGTEAFPGLLPGVIDEVAGVVHGKGQEIENNQQAGKSFLAMPEVVFEIISACLEDVEGLVLDFPAGPAAGGQFRDGVLAYREIGDEAGAVGNLAVGLDDLDFQPVDQHGVVPIAERDVRHPAIAVGSLLRAAPLGFAQAVEFDAGQIFAQGLVARGLAHQQKIAARRLDGLAHRLPGIEVVAQIDRLEPGIGRTHPAQPTSGRHRFAVLLRRAILGTDELGRQRQDRLVSGCHQRGANKGVEIFRPAIRALARRTVRTRKISRAEMFRPVQRDQDTPARLAERFQPTTSIDILEDRRKHTVKMVRRRSVEHCPDMIVARDRRHPQQRVAIRPTPPRPRRQRLLMPQERRALHEENRKRRQPDVRHRVAPVAPRPSVRQTGATLPKRPYVAIKSIHPELESQSDAGGKPFFGQNENCWMQALADMDTRQISLASKRMEKPDKFSLFCKLMEIAGSFRLTRSLS